MTTPRSHQSPNSDGQKPTADDATEALPAPAPEGATDDATEALPLAKGYEYVTADSGSTRAVIDTDDDSLAFGLMRNGDVVEKLTREERRADRAAEKAAAKEAERAEEARWQAALAAAAERDRLAPPNAADEQDDRKTGSKVFFVGSAVLTAAAIALVAAFLLPLNDNASRQTTVDVTPSPTVAEASSSAAESSAAAPVPSFNTKAPTVTEQDGGTEEPVAPGSVLYAPTQEAPVVEATLEPTPLESAVETAQPEPTLEETPAAEETLTLEPTPVATTPAEVVAPTDATPIDEPSRPVETGSATETASAASLPTAPAADGSSLAPTLAATTGP